MAPLFDIEGANLDQGYINLQAREHVEERRIVDALEAMWHDFEPYADPDFRVGFARDPDGRFWEMFVGCTLLGGQKELLAREDYPREGGNPDICVIDGDRRIWIEAIAPTAGDGQADQIPELIALNERGGVVDHPVRQVQLRITGALWNKARIIQGYRDEGIVREGDVCVVAIGGCRFGLLAGGGALPLAVSAVYPIGNEFIRVDRQNLQIVNNGHHRDDEIQRAGRNIPRTAFLAEEFAHISGLIWSRTSIGNMHRCARPLSFVHNYAADMPMPCAWGVWDKEFVAEFVDGDLRLTNVLAHA